MRYENVFGNTEWQSRMEKEDLLAIMGAFMKIYPMIVVVNLTQNTYAMVKGENFLFEKIGGEGESYDAMLQRTTRHIHPDYRNFFLSIFRREKLLETYGYGTNEVEARVIQKGADGKYRWVSNHAIRIEDESGDVIHVCLCRVLSQGLAENRGNRYGGARME